VAQLLSTASFARKDTLKMSDELNRLIEMARCHQMTEDDKEQQKISFAYGNTRTENDDITWDTVKKAAEELKLR
jgi:hypothetical protein